MTNQINNQSIIPSTDVIRLTLTLKMTTAQQVVETSVTVNNNSPIQDYVHPDDQTQPFNTVLLHCLVSHHTANSNYKHEPTRLAFIRREKAREDQQKSIQSLYIKKLNDCGPDNLHVRDECSPAYNHHPQTKKLKNTFLVLEKPFWSLLLLHEIK